MPALPRRRRLAALVGTVVGVLVAFVVVTAVTGMPGPGPLRRYQASELEDLVTAVHDSAGSIRTPDDCWQTLEPDYTTGDPRPIAAIDWVRSRVVVGVRSDNVGAVDRRTRAEVERRLEAIVASHPGWSMAMIEVEPSPEGWSPLVDCGLVVRGRAGF